MTSIPKIPSSKTQTKYHKHREKQSQHRYKPFIKKEEQPTVLFRNQTNRSAVHPVISIKLHHHPYHRSSAPFPDSRLSSPSSARCVSAAASYPSMWTLRCRLHLGSYRVPARRAMLAPCPWSLIGRQQRGRVACGRYSLDLHGLPLLPSAVYPPDGIWSSAARSTAA